MPVQAIVSVSGGKDSAAVATLALDANMEMPPRFVFADTGNEHPATIEYVTYALPEFLGSPIEFIKADFSAMLEHKRHVINTKWREEGIGNEICERAIAICQPSGNPFLDLCIAKGRFPSIKARFCTQELKRRPLDAVMLEALANGPIERWSGERRDESQTRADYPERERAAEGWHIVRPIVHWTAQETVDFLRTRGVPINPLYYEGFRRVGCAPCINSSKGDIRLWAERHPEMIDKIREWEAIARLASKRGVSTFFAGEDFTIDRVVEWSRTSHGGRQFDMLCMPGSMEGGCHAAYGLCE